MKKIEFYFPMDLPKPSKDDGDFSVDVFIIDQDGLYGLAYYSFVNSKWSFHTDTLVDYNEKGSPMMWKWCYPPFTVKDAGL